MTVFKRPGLRLGNRLGVEPTYLRSVCLALAFASLASSATAQQDISESELETLLSVKVRTVQHMALNPLLVRAARQQNATGLTVEEVARREKAWRASKELTPFKLSLQTSPAGRFLKQQIERNNSFNEAFLTDNQGANVAAFPPPAITGRATRRSGVTRSMAAAAASLSARSNSTRVPTPLQRKCRHRCWIVARPSGFWWSASPSITCRRDDRND